MDRIVSKIFAGGLSAGVFLIWWPQHVTADDLEHLVLRGLLWTLTFELLLLAFGPLEILVVQRLRARFGDRRPLRLRDRLAGVPTPARTGGVLALACCGLAAPMVLFADAPHQLTDRADAKPKVVRIVERPVIERKVVVRKVVGPAAADAAATDSLQSAGAAPSVTSPAAGRAAAPRRSGGRAATSERRTSRSDASAPAQQRSAPATRPNEQAPAATTTPAAPEAEAQAVATPPAPAPAGEQPAAPQS